MRSVRTAIVIDVMIATNRIKLTARSGLWLRKPYWSSDVATKYPAKEPVIMMSPWAKLMRRSTP